MASSSTSQHTYEVSLSGEFFSKDLMPILNRIALHSEFANEMHSREVIFDPITSGSDQKHDVYQELPQLRAKKELLEPNSGWYHHAATPGLLYTDTLPFAGCYTRT